MSANKAKGTRHETAVVNYLKDFGHDARRVVQTGRNDTGDIHVNDMIVIEAKDEARHRFPEYIRQANREATNAGLPYGVAVVKRRNANIRDAFVVMDLEMFARLISHVQR
ncbi:hypothetical protein [Streptomyces sp. NPDC007063]|uniref:hypothetical protein n=1 Tax=Streptomyces sp. NPDC007063 TaxID=3364772 RepID=UPI0036B79E2F